jgi:hypothetical protein
MHSVFIVWQDLNRLMQTFEHSFFNPECEIVRLKVAFVYFLLGVGTAHRDFDLFV